MTEHELRTAAARAQELRRVTVRPLPEDIADDERPRAARLRRWVLRIRVVVPRPGRRAEGQATRLRGATGPGGR